MEKKKIIFLIEKLKLGEKEYFNEFYDETKSSVYFMIFKILRNKELAEDVMQDVYVSFIENLYKIDNNKNVYSYLLTTAKNKAINEYKKVVKVEYIDYLENLPYECNSLEAPLLNYLKEKLTAEEWLILEQTIIFGYRRVEVAKHLNKPISTINWKYNQVLKKIKKLYKEVYNEKN